MTISTVILMVMVEMLVGGNDSGNGSGVDGIVSRNGDVDGSRDLGRDGCKGEHANGSH